MSVLHHRIYLTHWVRVKHQPISHKTYRFYNILESLSERLKTLNTLSSFIYSLYVPSYPSHLDSRYIIRYQHAHIPGRGIGWGLNELRIASEDGRLWGKWGQLYEMLKSHDARSSPGAVLTGLKVRGAKETSARLWVNTGIPIIWHDIIDGTLHLIEQVRAPFFETNTCRVPLI